MALRSDTNIDVDFYNKKYILINAKQYDRKSRFLSVSCYNHGELYPINAGEHSAYIRYKKPDNNSVFNFCEIDRRGKILVELTEQMLVSEGICYADLVIVNKGSANVNAETGEIVAIDNASILSTMTFCIDVSESAVENSDIESSYEFDGLNTALEKAEAEYTEVILLSKSYAVGNANGIRENENNDNAKYYYEQSLNSANNAKTSEQNAKISESNAKTSEVNADISETNAKISEQNAKTYMDNAKVSETKSATSEQNAKTYMDNSKVSEQNAKTSENNAKASEVNAKTSEANAEISMNSAKESETGALSNFNLSKSYAVGGTGVRANEDTDNAHYYCEIVKSVVDGLNSGFIPIGTVQFSDLAIVEKATGFTYNISDDFITDESFREGAGKSYTAGTNVYYTADGYWDCFGGSASATATVDEVISYLGL